MAQVNLAFEHQVSKSDKWAISGLEYAPPRIEAACPSQPRALDPNPLDFAPQDLAGRRVTTPSPYKVHAFIVSDEQAFSLFGNALRRDISEEAICAGDVCRSVTVGMYLTESQFADIDALAAYLEDAIGLE
jgi:hypothetical protein